MAEKIYDPKAGDVVDYVVSLRCIDCRNAT